MMEVLENNIVDDELVAAPHPGRFWTTDEHRFFNCYILCHVVVIFFNYIFCMNIYNN
jgi:hypothetical protein